MGNKKDEKRTLLIMAGVMGFVVVSIASWGIYDYVNTGRTEGVGVVIVALILTIFAMKMIKDKYGRIKKGEPLSDERERRLQTKSAAAAFYVGIYWLLGLSIFIGEGKLNISASSVPSIGIAGMAIIFGLAYWYFSKKSE